MRRQFRMGMTVIGKVREEEFGWWECSENQWG